MIKSILTYLKKMTPQPKLSGISTKILISYIEWQKILKHVPKMHRYSMGSRIDSLFAELVETVSRAMFSKDKTREIYVSKAIGLNDCLKFMLYAILEIGGITDEHFILISSPLEETGKMLFGWQNQIIRSDSKKHP